jgi:acyl carrier protein
MSMRIGLVVGMSIVVIGCSNDAQPGGSASGSTGAPPAQAAPVAGDGVPPRLRTAIASTLKIDESRVTPTASFATDLGADELSMVELVMAYEREFKVNISDADADRFTRVQDVVNYLRRHQR